MFIAETRSGRFEGVAEDGAIAFHGVPFARPPIGERRFRAPQQLPDSSELRRAQSSGPASYQVNPRNQTNVQELLVALGDHFPGVKNSPPFSSTTYFQAEVSEDCLYLDIWVPRPPTSEKLPVFVYYHGGANAGSSGSMLLERGGNLARQENVIVVRPSYRLGALGWVHFGLVSSELSEAINLGVQDQMAALNWISENIAAFGGDPQNITIGGESAGATAVSHLLLNAQSRPLFRRAILQSLSPFNQWSTQQKSEAMSVIELYMLLLKSDSYEQLLKTDPDHFLAVNLALGRYFDADTNCAWRPLGAVVEGQVVPHQPAVHLAEAPLPADGLEVMIGFAKDEWQFFRGHTGTNQTGRRRNVENVMSQVVGPERAVTLYDEFSKLHPNHSPGDLLGDMMSCEFFKFSSLQIAENLARAGISTHVFEFAFELPGQGGRLRAFHTGDMPFIWRNFAAEDLKRWPAFEGLSPADISATSETFGRYYGAFIRGEPIGQAWPSFDTERESILWLGKEIYAVDHLLTAEIQAFRDGGISTVRELETQLVKNVHG